MRKSSIIPKRLRGFSFLSFRNKQPAHITIQLTTHDPEKYLTSFLKKRVLIAWKEHRYILHNPMNNPSEKHLYQRTYNQLKPLFLASYAEDFKHPYTRFSFQSWLQYVKILAQITGKYKDVRYWEEVSQFISFCTQHNLLDL